MIEVYRTEELRQYSGKVASCAFLLQAFIVCILICLPLGIVYGSGGLFRESNVIREHLTVTIARHVRGWILSDSGESPFSVSVNKNPRCSDVLPAYLSSSLEYVSTNIGARVLTADIIVPRPRAGKLRGIVLLLPITFEIPKLDSPLLFSTKMLTFPANAHLNHFIFNGVLKVNPSMVLSPEELWNYKKQSLGRFCEISQLFINKTADILSLTEITTEVRSNPSVDGISIELKLNLPENVITIQSSFWYTIKFAWVQYLCVALLLFFAAEELRSFCYSGQLVHTTVSSTLDYNYKKKLL
nr:unnamed protein product [Spirometra erinaceieuropaei]